MADSIYELELYAEQDDQSSAIFRDVSEYIGENRSDKPNFLVVAKMDKNGTPTFIEGVPVSNPFSRDEWQFDTPVDGWYNAYLIRPATYTSSPVTTQAEQSSGGVITQHATILYHTATGQVVKAKTSGVVNVQPGEAGWETYWEIVTDLSTLAGYGDVCVLIWGDLVDARFRDALRDGLDEINAKPWSNNPFDRAKLYEKYYEFDADINGLQAKNAAGEYAEMEEMARIIEEKYLNK